ncbi:MAG: hypothetical protein R6U10_07495 [Thermoplasmatota archaeon]
MSYRLPSSEEVVVAIYKALHKHGTIDTQHRLRREVLQELRAWDNDYTVSEERVRELAARATFARVDVYTREGDGEARRCPVCGGDLQRVKNRSLWGKEVTVGYTCETCSYRGGVRQRVPTRYVFHLDERRRNSV